MRPHCSNTNDSITKRTVYRRQLILGRSPLRPPRLHRPGLGRLHPAAVEGPETGWGLLLCRAHTLGEVLPEGCQKKVAVGKKLVGRRSLLLWGHEGRKRAKTGGSLGLGAVEVCRNAQLETVTLEKEKENTASS